MRSLFITVGCVFILLGCTTTTSLSHAEAAKLSPACQEEVRRKQISPACESQIDAVTEESRPEVEKEAREVDRFN